MSELAESNISVVNNVFIKQLFFALAGQQAITHAHVYDHQTLLAVGALRLTVDGVATEYQAPAILVIAAGKHHGMTALVDGTVAYCIHAMNDEPLVMGIENDQLTQLA
jgi:quercetin dioxygenase-like cupin family protein